MSDQATRVTDTIVRITAVALLAISCFRIVAPFVALFAWAVIIAVAVRGFYERLVGLFGGHRKTASAAFVAVALAVLIAPAVLLSETLITGARDIGTQMAAGTLMIPPPPESVADWPLIGSSIYPFWKLASENLQAAVEQLRPQLKALSGPLLSTAGAAGLGILQMIVSIVIAAVLLANSAGAGRFASLLTRRIAGQQGDALGRLSEATIRSVSIGILGVGVIQSLLAGIGFLVVGVPGAGLWALLVLIAAVVQLPVLLLMIPICAYVFTAATTTAAVVFTVWCVFVALMDNVLKPILFAHGGADVPVLVIFLGSIGGLISAGLVGLFIGPVILAVGYEVVGVWLAGAGQAPADTPVRDA